MVENDVCVDPSSVLDGRPNYAKITCLTMPTSPFQGSLLGLAQVGLRSLTRDLIMQLAFFQGSMLGL